MVLYKVLRELTVSELMEIRLMGRFLGLWIEMESLDDELGCKISHQQNKIGQ